MSEDRVKVAEITVGSRTWVVTTRDGNRPVTLVPDLSHAPVTAEDRDALLRVLRLLGVPLEDLA